MFQPQCITWPCDPIPTTPVYQVPGSTGGRYPVPTTIPSDPYAQRGGNTGVTGGMFPSEPAPPVFSATTNELDRFRWLLLILGLVAGYYYAKHAR